VVQIILAKFSQFFFVCRKKYGEWLGDFFRIVWIFLVMLFSVVIENSGLAAVHSDSASRAYKGLIARSYWGFSVRRFGWVLAAVLFC
jgi:hypothetical protein